MFVQSKTIYLRYNKEDYLLAPTEVVKGEQLEDFDKITKVFNLLHPDL